MECVTQHLSLMDIRSIMLSIGLILEAGTSPAICSCYLGNRVMSLTLVLNFRLLIRLKKSSALCRFQASQRINTQKIRMLASTSSLMGPPLNFRVRNMKLLKFCSPQIRLDLSVRESKIWWLTQSSHVTLT